MIFSIMMLLLVLFSASCVLFFIFYLLLPSLNAQHVNTSNPLFSEQEFQSSPVVRKEANRSSMSPGSTPSCASKASRRPGCTTPSSSARWPSTPSAVSRWQPSSASPPTTKSLRRRPPSSRGSTACLCLSTFTSLPTIEFKPSKSVAHRRSLIKIGRAHV